MDTGNQNAKLDDMLEAEKRGFLPRDQAAILAEARQSGLVASASPSPPSSPSIDEMDLAQRDKKRQEVLRLQKEWRAQTGRGAVPGSVGGVSASATDGFLFGFGDEYLAGLSAALGVQPDGQGGANWFDYQKPIGERYSTALNAIREEQEAFRDEKPMLSVATEFAGGLLGPGKGASAFINRGHTAAARVGRGALTGSVATGAYGYGEGEDTPRARMTRALMNAPVGALGGGAIVGMGQGFNRALQTLKGRPELREAIPSVEGLREAASGLYARARELGGELPEDSVRSLAERAQSATRDSGFDRQLHPRVAAVLDRLKSETGPKSLQDVEILRRVAGNAAESLQPDERRIASQVIDAIDEAVEGMGAASPVLREARDTWARLRRLEVIEMAIDKASLQDNFAAGLRSQFKTLLRNPKRLRGFSQAEVRAIREVASGTATVKALRGLASLLSPTGLPGMALAGGTAIAGPGIAPAIGVAATGLGTRSLADALTRRAATRARDTVGMSEARRALLEALKERGNPLARPVPSMGYLGEEARP